MEQRKKHTDDIIFKIKEDFKKCSILDSNMCLVVTGSFGREEASDQSDMDWYLISSIKLDSSVVKQLEQTIDEIISKYVEKNVGGTGTFGAVIESSDLLNNFGGELDSNKAFTRRMLYLLESKWLYNEDMYISLKKEILDKYIKSSVPNDSINKFMLNDVIRYYRTICTDYQYKVSEQGKSWGVRKIKLRFSRKLLYFSGLITVAETHGISREEKLNKTYALLELSPIARIAHIFGDDFNVLKEQYSYFLTEISKESVRDSLDSVVESKRKENDKYVELSELSKGFESELNKIFNSKYEKNHPIHASLVF
ncbi:hypothetical protein [Vibrio splendidus]|uniref:hypothetical protein n=1 Tax=Vibrio splendidus TaxID=29497 RepID=UPI001FB41ED5|nr:hypothetical protein [Vibrio splendidus]UOE84293.1 hypothetical protein LTQ54_15335 [Vibrio splendidus]UOE90251.1 hypothetical protein LTQ02_07095 [Vibrio splendidus]